MSTAFYLEVERCSGCFACTVACMDQNDLEVREGPTAWRQVFAVETGNDFEPYRLKDGDRENGIVAIPVILGAGRYPHVPMTA